MNEQPLVTIIILNWKQRELTNACLESVMCLAYPIECLNVVVVDNASQDGSVEAIRDANPSVIVIENTENLGYAGGNNVGIRWALKNGSKYILILNNDTILASDMVNQLVSVMVKDANISVTGPMLYHADEAGIIQSAGGTVDRNWRSNHRGENQVDNSQFSTPQQVDWLSGCALLVRAQAIRQTGMFDERFFSYYEDLDWCLRMKAAGWKIIHAPQAKIWHTGVRPNYQPKPYVTYYMARNQLLLLQKHHAPLSAWVRAISADLRTLLSWTLRIKWKAKRAHRNALWRGMLDFIFQRWGKAEIPG